jgi:hypothetical protein
MLGMGKLGVPGLPWGFWVLCLPAEKGPHSQLGASGHKHPKRARKEELT